MPNDQRGQDGGAWIVRPYLPGDEGRITELFEEVFGRSISVEQYRWKVLDSTWPIAAPTVWLAEAGERIVGQYAGTPMRFKLSEQEVTVIHSCDAMTARAFRRQGVLSAVGNAATEGWRAGGVPFVTGLPHSGWGTRRHYLGWRECFKAVWMWYPLQVERLLARRRPVIAIFGRVAAVPGRVWHCGWGTLLGWKGRGVTVEPVEQVGGEFDDLWRTLKGQYEALVVRDRAWIAYRYIDVPSIEYRLLLARRAGRPVGYLVYRVTRRHDPAMGWIVDLFTGRDDHATRAALMRFALHQLDESGAAAVRVLLAKGTPLINEFRTAGFLRAPGEYEVSVVPLADNEPPAALRDPNRWFTMAGDYDIV